MANRISTDNAPKPGGHYAQATKWTDLIHVSGQLPFAPDGAPVTGDFARQAAQAIDNLLAIVAAAGGGPDTVLKVNAYIVGVEHWPAFNAVFAECFGEARPARAVIPVPELHHGFLIEVDAVAVSRSKI